VSNVYSGSYVPTPEMNITILCLFNQSDLIMGLNNDNSNIPTNMMTLEISERDPKLDDDYTLGIDVSNADSVINHSTRQTHETTDTDDHRQTNNRSRVDFPTILKMVVTSTQVDPFHSDDDEDDSPPDRTSHTR
jgi:hypothetical protein